MSVIYKLIGEVPADLPPGEYGTILRSAEWQGPNLVIEVEFDPNDPHRDSLFHITKESQDA